MPSLLGDLEAQSFQDFELLLVVGVRPNGRARNVGAAETRGEYLIFIDDDVRLGHDRILDQLVTALAEHAEFGLVGPSQQIPVGSTWLQRRMANQLPRTRFPIVDDFQDTDMVSHMCLAIRRSVWDEVGGESDTLVRGTDPDLRFRIRAAGYRVVVVPHAWAYHPLPDTLSQLLRMWFSAGVGAAEVFLSSPGKVIDTPDSFQETGVYRRPFLRRVSDAVRRTLAAAARRQELRLLCQAAYSLGYLKCVITQKVVPTAGR